jgi:hypothetical protein
MKINPSKYRWAQIACLSLWPILMCGQSSDRAQNLADCKNGMESCDRSRFELTDVAHSQHVQNVTNCRNGYDSCDRSKLTEREAIALAVADHERNVSDCTMGLSSCNPSQLTASEARDWNVVQDRRNLVDCQDGYDACDRSKLSPRYRYCPESLQSRRLQEWVDLQSLLAKQHGNQ